MDCNLKIVAGSCILTHSIFSKNKPLYDARNHTLQLKPENNVRYLFRTALKIERIVKPSWIWNKSVLS